MSILGQEAITLDRFAAGLFGADGRWVIGAATSSTIQASVQPMQGQDRELLEESQRQLDGKKVYTTTALRTADQHASLAADRLTIDSIVYEVVNVKRERSVIAHYKVLVLRIAEGE